MEVRSCDQKVDKKSWREVKGEYFEMEERSSEHSAFGHCLYPHFSDHQHWSAYLRESLCRSDLIMLEKC